MRCDFLYFQAEPGAKPNPTLKDSVVNLSEENAALKAHIAELEAARDAEDLRGLLGRVLAKVEDLHPELRAAIKWC